MSKFVAGTPDAATLCLFVRDCPAALKGLPTSAEMEPWAYSINMTTFEPCQIPGHQDSVVIDPQSGSLPLPARGCSYQFRCTLNCMPMCSDPLNWKPLPNTMIQYPDGSNLTIPLYHYYNVGNQTDDEFSQKCNAACGDFGGTAKVYGHFPEYNPRGFCSCRTGKFPNESILTPFSGNSTLCSSGTHNKRSGLLFMLLLSGLPFLF